MGLSSNEEDKMLKLIPLEKLKSEFLPEDFTNISRKIESPDQLSLNDILTKTGVKNALIALPCFNLTLREKMAFKLAIAKLIPIDDDFIITALEKAEKFIQNELSIYDLSSLSSDIEHEYNIEKCNCISDPSHPNFVSSFKRTHLLDLLKNVFHDDRFFEASIGPQSSETETVTSNNCYQLASGATFFIGKDEEGNQPWDQIRNAFSEVLMKIETDTLQIEEYPTTKMSM